MRCKLLTVRVFWLALTSFLLAFGALAQRGPAGPQATTTPPPARFYYMGPPPGGRTASVVGQPGDPSIYYFGQASGGLWKTTDGGETAVPIFDNQDVAAIGTLAMDPQDSNTIWVGTGEPWIIRWSDVVGDGIYVTHDAGKTFTHIEQLRNTGRIARIVVSPSDSNTVWVCAEGRLTGPQQDKGVFKTTDGGKTWKQTLFVNPVTGCSDLAVDPNNPKTVLAGMWEVTENTWAELSGSPDGHSPSTSGVYISHDGGDTFTKITPAQGMPHGDLGKIGVAIARSNGQRMYALIQTAEQGSMWRSDDGGSSWKVVSWDRSLIGRAGYYFRIAVDPFNENEVLVASSSFHRSMDGGLHFTAGGGGGGGGRGAAQASCGDCHDIWMDPKINGRYALTDDAGAAISNGRGQVQMVSFPNGQMYHVLADNQVPYFVYSNRQDNGTWRGPSTVSAEIGNGREPLDTFMPEAAGRGGRGFGGFGRGGAPPPPSNGLYGGPPSAAAGRGGRGAGSLVAGPGPTLEWESGIGGCESGWTVPDPKDANIIWASCYGNKLTRFDAREGEAHSVEPWEISLDSPPNEVKYRCHWTAPVAIDPFNPQRVFYGCQMILMTQNQGYSWTQFSPDLSTQNPARIISNGGVEGDNLAQFDGEVVWDIAPSPITPNLIWAGTNDGKIWYTKDPNGKNWVDVTNNLLQSQHLPLWGQINAIAPSNFDSNTAYVAVDFHLGTDNYKPYMFKTTDMGKTWKNINGDIPSGNPLDYIMCIAENPNRKGMLFASSAHAFYYSLDDGAHWVKFTTGLPPSPVSWINVEKRFHDVDVSTYGRGLYILPDITVLEQSGQIAPDPATTKLYAPTAIFRTARDVFPTEAQPARPQFILNLASEPQNGHISYQITDSAGKLVQHATLAAHAGVNGIDWNLHYDGPTLVELRTTPPENPHIWDELRFQGKNVRPITHWGITPTTGVPLAAPGSYQIQVTVNGQTFKQPFTVTKDPAVLSSDADLVASTQMQVRCRDDITETSDMVNQMEIWRKQIEDQRYLHRTNAADTRALDDLNNRILAVEHQLVTEADMLSDDKHFPVAYGVYMNLIWTSGAVGEGASDEAGGVDYRPTQTQYEVVADIESHLAKAKADYDKLPAAIAAFNAQMKGQLPAIVNPLPAADEHPGPAPQ